MVYLGNMDAGIVLLDNNDDNINKINVDNKNINSSNSSVKNITGYIKMNKIIKIITNIAKRGLTLIMHILSTISRDAFNFS